jgi:putative phosphonate catabolism associated alcohol dehydrogenase
MTLPTFQEGRVALYDGPGRPLRHVHTSWEPPEKGEVLVRIMQCAICRSDVHTLEGRRQVATPTVLGHEIIGRVVSMHPSMPIEDLQGNAIHPGDRITWAIYAHCGHCFFCDHDLPQKCLHLFKYGHQPVCPDGSGSSGGMADYITLRPGTPILRLPASIPDNAATPLNCAMSTAAALLREAGKPWVNQASIMVIGGGYAGLSAVALARDQGAKNIVVVEANPAFHERCIAFGADAVVECPQEAIASIVSQTKENNRGFDLVLELAGSSRAASMALESVRTGGKMMLAGTVFTSPPIELDPEAMVKRCLSIQGVHNYHPADLVTATRFMESSGSTLPWASMFGHVGSFKDIQKILEWAAHNPGQRAFARMES